MVEFTLTNEQKALQFLLRAEATFRQIQVAFGAQGGGGGGGGAARDLAALFDLELDTEMNQYETRKSVPTSKCWLFPAGIGCPMSVIGHAAQCTLTNMYGVQTQRPCLIVEEGHIVLAAMRGW